jgi:integrase
MVLNEAEARGYIPKNPIRNERLERNRPKEKSVWTEAEINTVRTALETPALKFGWLHTSFLLGYYQAARIGQSPLPISCIDLERKIIHWPDQLVKGGRGFDQSIDPRFLPILKELIEHRTQQGKTTLCDMTGFASLGWRRFLDGLGFLHLSHHGLRSSWVTKAALAGIPESAAKKFVNHSSSIVHQIYTRITAQDVGPMLERLSS